MNVFHCMLVCIHALAIFVNTQSVLVYALMNFEHINERMSVELDEF